MLNIINLGGNGTIAELLEKLKKFPTEKKEKTKVKRLNAGTAEQMLDGQYAHRSLGKSAGVWEPACGFGGTNRFTQVAWGKDKIAPPQDKTTYIGRGLK